MTVDQLDKHNVKLYTSNKDIYNKLEDSNFTNLQKLILSHRLDKPDDINNLEKYINYKLDLSKDLYDLKDVDLAGKLITKHIQAGSHICVATDCDADGVSSAAVMYLALTNIFGLKEGVNLTTLVNRRKQGNGFNPTLVKRIMDIHNEKPINLIICCDHGSSDEIPINGFVDIGIDFCLTDHHQIPELTPPVSATVFVNPQREDSKYTKEISGCFVAFITLLATYNQMYNKIDMDKFNNLLPYVAITTISDVMSLRDPLNREIVKAGLNELNSMNNKLWLAIKTMFGINTIIDSTEIGFKISPLINTANRVDEEDTAFNLLISDNFQDALKYANQLSDLSIFRKKEQKKLFKDAEIQIPTLKYTNSIVLKLESTLAINGIIASQIGEAYGRPTVCFIDSNNSDVINGSARGILDNIDLVKALYRVKELDNTIFIKFGGHLAAAGCSIYKDKLEIFRELFDKAISEQVDMSNLDLTTYIDSYIQSDDITPTLVKEISRLEPFGKDWEYPTFCTLLKISYMNIYGNMVKFGFRTNKGRSIDGMYFFNKKSKYNKDTIETMLNRNKQVVVIFKPQLNNFASSTNIQLTVVDIFNQNEF